MLCEGCGQLRPTLGTPDTIHLEVTARPKQRPRFGKGRAYMDADYMAWKQGVAEEAHARGLRQHDGALSLSAVFSRDATDLEITPIVDSEESRKGRLTGDVDNYIGGLMDALQGVGYSNDRQIQHTIGWIR